MPRYSRAYATLYGAMLLLYTLKDDGAMARRWRAGCRRE